MTTAFPQKKRNYLRIKLTQKKAQKQEGENPQAQKTRFKTCLKSILHLDSSAMEPIGGGQEEDVIAC